MVPTEAVFGDWHGSFLADARAAAAADKRIKAAKEARRLDRARGGDHGAAPRAACDCSADTASNARVSALDVLHPRRLVRGRARSAAEGTMHKNDKGGFDLEVLYSAHR